MERSKKRKYVNVPVRERKALSRSRCWYTSLQGDYFRIEKLAFPLSHCYSVLRWGEINVVMTPGLSVKYIISFFFVSTSVTYYRLPLILWTFSLLCFVTAGSAWLLWCPYLWTAEWPRQICAHELDWARRFRIFNHLPGLNTKAPKNEKLKIPTHNSP